jgi:hypothetical protein
MKWKYRLLVFSLVCLALGNELYSNNSKAQPWWLVKLNISVTGTYFYIDNDIKRIGEYSFLVTSLGSMEHDEDKDYIYFQGNNSISDIKWRENYLGKGEVDLSSKVHLAMKLNYVLKTKGYLYFDFEILISEPIAENPILMNNLLLPCSKQNQSIHPENNYNQGIIKGSNGISLREKLILKQPETCKEFNWSWKAEREDFSNAHKVILKLSVNKK